LEGWCLLISKKIFEGIGCFDENFTPAFSEDADLSFRLRREGFKTKIVVGVNIIHYGNKTVFSQQDFDVTKVSKENSLKLKEKLKIKNRGEQNK
jgi:GT2 family glycosyltransferase